MRDEPRNFKLKDQSFTNKSIEDNNNPAFFDSSNSLKENDGLLCKVVKRINHRKKNSP